MRFQLIAVLVLVTFAFVINAESGVQDREKFDSNHEVIDGKARHLLTLREGRKLTVSGELPVENEERGILSSTNNFISKLTTKLNIKNLRGVKKTDKFTGEQVKTVSKAVATEVKKNPKAWPIIKNSLKFLFGATMVALITLGVFTVIHSARNYT